MQTFEHKTYKDKKSFIRSKGLCYGCLRNENHLVKNCPKRLVCDKYNGEHPLVLHREFKPEERVVSTSVGMVDADCRAAVSTEVTCRPVIIPVGIRCKSTGASIQTYAFIDNGSDSVFCTEDVRQRLNVGGRKTKLNLHTITGNRIMESRMIKGLEVTDLEGNQVIKLPTVYTQDKIPVSKKGILTQADISCFLYLSGVHLPHIESDIGLLIGNNVPKAFEPHQAGRDEDDSIIPVSVNRIQVGPLVDAQLAIDDKSEDSVEDKRFRKIVDSGTEVLNGHFQVELSFRDKDVVMPNNRNMVEQRLRHLKRKFERNAQYRNEYTKFMNVIIDKSYAEKIPAEDEAIDGRIWYLPHHGVYHPQKGKIRVVFDFGAEYGGTSLNKQLMQGPDLTNSLVRVLLRFRQDRVALMADIEAMFSQVKVPKEHQDYQRFLWWPNGDVTQPVAEYRMMVHIFGATSSPGCANYALKNSADSSEDTNVRSTIQHNFYVDDMLKAVLTVTERRALAEGLIDTCKKSGFCLTKWMSNERHVLEVKLRGKSQ
ncbi:uncharacterized protein LOC102809470 [Saccoglossus kowalevskii]|uniref:Uncharacterized protein LOC102809470 n=1 Tax=Saccoglossus kowalevskii TaxID=10224 RepID=A0ABM0MVL8_SACKO|nr:PREDICTED: uncharacterized protein LOC102809470 [Saccoglossus kowalevskii]